MNITPCLTSDEIVFVYLVPALQDKVASFELPSAFVQLSEFPLGLTGKIDMKQLPEPPAPLKPKMNKSASGLSLQDGLLTATEKLVLKSWESVLAEGSVNMTMLDTSFFDLGGHSLMVAKVGLGLQPGFCGSLKCKLTLPVKLLFAQKN